jgi:hypothetical protein
MFGNTSGSTVTRPQTQVIGHNPPRDFNLCYKYSADPGADELMVSFIHIADKNDEQAILRNGIRSKNRRAGVRGVYATPVVPNFATTHQWSRELKRRGIRTLICVQFKIPDEDLVLVGAYNGEKLEMTAAEALGAVLKHTDPMGLEVVIPRKISAREITRTYLAPQTTG